MSEYIPVKIAKAVKKRASFCCEYCLALSDFAFHPFVIEHIIPTSKDGANTLDNLALACQHCNSSKYDKTIGIDALNQIEVSLYHPRQDVWNEHFIWNKTQTIIIGITPTGRATVDCLKMNREKVQNLRAALREYGVHPPKL